MAKVKFDRDDVIESSAQLFWSQGFAGSSMQQVSEVTGLRPGSIYLAFGSKEGLYQETLRAYGEKSIAEIRHVLVRAPTVEAGICWILRNMVDESNDAHFRSCFLVKSQLELAHDFPELHHFSASWLKQIEQVYADSLASSYTEYSEQEGRALATSRARSIMFHIFGLRIYGYAASTHSQLVDALRVGLPWLPWDEYQGDFV